MKTFDQFVNESSSIENFKREIREIEKSRELKKWLKLNGFDQKLISSLSKMDLILGGCTALAAYFHYKYGLEIYYIDEYATDKLSEGGHTFVKYGDLYYDAMNPEGVSTPGDFYWSKMYSKQLSSKSMTKLVRKLEDYESYEEFEEVARKMNFVS